MQTLSTAIDYAQRVIEGEVPAGRLTRLACERFLRDLQDPDLPYVFDEALAERAHRFISKLRHVDGKLGQQGAPFTLEPWQVFVVANIFGWVREDSGLRRFLYVYLEVPRGNGKSMLLSAIGIYLAFAEGPEGAETYAAATSERQARIVYDTSRRILSKVPDLQEALGIKAYIKQTARPSKGQIFEPISGIPRDGKRVYAALYDELHEAPDQSLWNSLIQSMGKFHVPSVAIAITTAGYDQTSFCYRFRSDLVAILEGETQDERTFGVIYCADEGDDWETEEAILKANPNLHVSVSLDTLLAERDRALRDPYQEYVYKTKRLCIWVNARSGHFNMGLWEEAGRPTSDLLTLEADWYIGADLGSKEDLSAVVAACKIDGVLHAHSHFFIPQAVADRVHAIPYEEYARQGFITITPGAITDFDYIERYVEQLSKKLGAKAVAFDPFNATQLMVNLRKRRVPVLEVRTTYKNMTEPMSILSAAITSESIVHSANPIMDLHMANTVAARNWGGQIKPEKPRDPSKKIDGTVALLNAIHRIHAAELEAASARRFTLIS